MKRILLTTALLAATMGASAGSFKGGYAGVDIGWTWTQATFNSHVTGAGTNKGFNQNGFSPFVKIGYGETCGAVYVGGELKGGYVFSNAKNGTDKLTRQWNWGVAARIGGYFEHNVLGYFRLGVDNDQYSYKFQGGSTTKNVPVWSVVPGLGVDWMVAHNTFTTLAVDYGIPFSTSMPSGTSAKTKPTSTTVRVGVGYQF